MLPVVQCSASLIKHSLVLCCLVLIPQSLLDMHRTLNFKYVDAWVFIENQENNLKELM